MAKIPIFFNMFLNRLYDYTIIPYVFVKIVNSEFEYISVIHDLT